jgi:hypothetical protein
LRFLPAPRPDREARSPHSPPTDRSPHSPPTDSLDYAMAECVAEGIDEILNSDDDVEDDTDEE